MGRQEIAGRGLFYGWIIVAAAFVIMFLGFGAAYSFPAFFQTFQQTFSANRGDVSLVFSISGFLYFSLGALSGPIADRAGPRGVILFGMVLIGGGMWCTAYVDALWQVYALYSLAVGVGVGFSYVPAIGVVQHWFVRRRGLASGIAVAGIGFGTLAVPPISVELIALFGWRNSYQILGLSVLIMGIGAALLLRRSPRDMGLNPDGDPGTVSVPQPDAKITLPGTPAAEALLSKPFIGLYLAAAATSFSLFIPFVHIAAYAQDHGLSQKQGVWLLSVIGLGSLIGRFAVGALADRIGRRRGIILLYLGIGLSMIYWYFATSFVELAIYAVVFGSFYGGFVALGPALTADYFGARQISTIIGTLYTSVAIGTLLGPTIAGYAFDLLNSYSLPILGAAAFNILAVLIMLLVPEPAVWHRLANSR